MSTTIYETTAAGSGAVEFLWSLLPVIILGVIIGTALGMNRSHTYRRIIADFFANRYQGLERKAERIRKKVGPNRRGKMRKENATAYNNLCHVLASLALFRGDDAAFLDRISEMEYEDEYALRPFTLALYYLMMQQPEVAEEHYFDFNACPQEDDSMKIVMDHLFDRENAGIEAEDLYAALGQFKNPATVYLLKKVGLLEDE